jgi:hypothetical protein
VAQANTSFDDDNNDNDYTVPLNDKQSDAENECLQFSWRGAKSTVETNRELIF